MASRGLFALSCCCVLPLTRLWVSHHGRQSSTLPCPGAGNQVVWSSGCRGYRFRDGCRPDGPSVSFFEVANDQGSALFDCAGKLLRHWYRTTQTHPFTRRCWPASGHSLPGQGGCPGCSFLTIECRGGSVSRFAPEGPDLEASLTVSRAEQASLSHTHPTLPWTVRQMFRLISSTCSFFSRKKVESLFFSVFVPYEGGAQCTSLDPFP